MKKKLIIIGALIGAITIILKVMPAGAPGDILWMTNYVGGVNPVAIRTNSDLRAELYIPAERYIELARITGETTNLVNLLVSSGEFCRIRGHVWGPAPHLTLEYYSEPREFRRCVICGKEETRSMPAWPSP